ncbi:DUF2147 domain-containing protein [Labrys monachus]|uniref:Uncharacterized protein (DUF2147 family) n=1 Tax=Labrys monachus TaxID=217067 RepID=A0ABU0FMG3_9HYPH|nr:DUF2147 domain-containing protein [Labrys monachus]MDQ0395802.1 uncharacterized protein (DUF2147 family) [Labrys monachus]
MRKHLPIPCLAVAGMLSLSGGAEAQSAQAGHLRDAFGNWSRDDGQAKVRIAPCGKAVCATNTWIRDRDSSEKVGDRLEMTLKATGAAMWAGQAYDPKRRMTFAMTMTLSAGRLQTRGCMLGGLLCRNVGWTRVR